MPRSKRASADSSISFADTIIWLIPSCSSRDSRARSCSCDSTTRCASSLSFASVLRDSLTFSTSAHTAIAAAPVSAIAVSQLIVRSMFADARASMRCSAVSTSSR